jgi:hypothetical protein
MLFVTLTSGLLLHEHPRAINALETWFIATGRPDPLIGDTVARQLDHLTHLWALGEQVDNAGVQLALELLSTSHRLSRTISVGRHRHRHPVAR